MNTTRLKTPLIFSDPQIIYPVESLKFDDDPVSRREFLRKGGTTAIVLTLAPSVLFTQDAEANPITWLAWTGKAAFAGGISWLIGRVLDIRFPNFGRSLKAGNKLAKELGVQIVEPKPTKTDRFHNSHASPYAVLSPKYRFKPKYSERYEYFVGLDRYLRSDADNPLPDFKDLSTPEIKRIAKEEDYYDTILFPCGQRKLPVRGDYAGYKRTSEEYYNTDPDLMQLEYVRPFNDGTDSYLSYGVKSKRTGEKDLLISV